MTPVANMAGFERWVRQPTTITGLGALAGTIVGAVALAIAGDTSTAVAAGSVTFALTHLVIDDNTAAAQLKLLVTDAVQAASGGEAGLISAAPMLMRDGVGAIEAVTAANEKTPAAAT